MRKTLATAIAAVMFALSANAQSGYNDTKHEIAIGYGAVSNSQWIDIYEKMLNTLVGAKLDNETFVGPISAEYFYHAKNWLGIGGIAVFGQSTQDIYVSRSKSGKDKNTYFTLLPAVKLDWLRKKNFGMYSKFGIGATMRHESIDYNPTQEEAQKSYSNSNVHFNWQASLIGIEAGSPTLRGFVELGVGEQGVAIGGIRYKF